MTELLLTLIRGLGQGSVYALIALAFVIIYKSTRVVSFSVPALTLCGATITALLQPRFGFWVAAAIGLGGTALVGLLAERVFLRPMVGEPVFVVAIITIGIDIAIRTVLNRFIGTQLRFVDDPWGINTVQIGDYAIPQIDLARIVAVAIIATLLFLYFQRSRFGLAMRATAFDQETALAQGINVGTVFAASWMIAGLLAAVGGILADGGSGVSQLSWIVALRALPAIIIGGLDSLGGAVVGGLAVGLSERLFALYANRFAESLYELVGMPEGTTSALLPFLGTNFEAVIPYVLLLIVLMVRPYGIWGTPEVERL